MLKDWPSGAVAVIVGRVDDPFRLDIPGMQDFACWNCGEPCKVSSYTLLQVTALKEWRFLCVQCAAAYVDRSGQKLHVLRQG